MIHDVRTSARSRQRAVIWTSMITALGGLLFGYDTGVVSGALLFLQDSFGKLSAFDKELVTSLLLVGAAVGALVAGRLADRIGRRPVILLTATVFIIGVLGAAFAPAFGLLVVMRFVIGLAVGSASMVVPLYIGELAPPQYRGALVSFNQLAITIGILVSYLTGYWLSSGHNWRLMGWRPSPPGCSSSGPSSSPKALTGSRRGRDDEARHILERYREPENIDAELEDIHQVSDQKVSGRRLLDPRLRGVLTLGVMMAIFQQVTGINTVIYYAPTLLHGAGLGSSAALLANVINGAVNVGMTVVAIRLLDRTGRRPLLLAGTTGMAVGMMVVGCTFGFGGDSLHGATALVAVLGLLIYTGSFAIGLGPVFWLLISEIYPQQVRGPAMSVATLANWTANFVVTVSFLTLLNAIHGVGVFFLFGALTLIALVYFAKRVPETKNLSLEEIQRQIDGSRSSTFAPSGPSATTGPLPTIGGRLSPS